MRHAGVDLGADRGALGLVRGPGGVVAEPDLGRQRVEGGRRADEARGEFGEAVEVGWPGRDARGTGSW